MIEVAYTPPFQSNPAYETKASQFNFYQYLIMFGQRITASTLVNNVLYTVPKGKSFFLINYTISAGVQAGDTIAEGERIIVAIGTGNPDSSLTTIGILKLGSCTTGQDSFSAAPILPIRLVESETLLAVNGTPTTAHMDWGVTIVGYEIDSSVLPNLF